MKINQGHWAIGPNLNYTLRNEWMMRQSDGSDTKVTGIRPVLTSLGSDSSLRGKMTVQDNNWMKLNLLADWKFMNLCQAFADAVGTQSRTLLLYSDVVHSNLVGDTEHPLVRKWSTNAIESVYFEPLHVQWMPVRRPYMDVIEVQLANRVPQTCHRISG